MAQNLAVDEAGNVWDMSSGQPRFVSGPQQSIQTKPADQTMPFKVTQERNQAAASQFAPQIAGADAAIKGAQAGTAGVVAQADAQKAVADAQRAQAELAKLKLEQSQADPKSGAYKSLQEQIDRVSELFRRDIQGGLPNPLWGHLPTPANSAFSSAAQGLVNPYMQAFRIPGVGSQSDTELRQFIEGNVPQPTDTDAQIQEKIGNLQRQLDSRVPPQVPNPPDQMGITQGNTRAEVDPVLKAVAGKVGVMLSNGAPRTQIEEFLKKSGVDPASTDLDAKIKYRATPEFKRWQRANPGAPYPIDPSFYTKQIPMSDARSLLNQSARDGIGGALQAGVLASANAISGGRLDNLVSDPAMAQTGMDLMRGRHPNASFLGDLAGQASVEATLGRIPGAQSLMATRWGRRGADALYGAYSGSGENDGDPLVGAFTGALTNMGGGMFGRGAQRSLGRIGTGVKNAHLQYLDNLGIPLTVGRIARGSESTLGHAIGGIEERMAGLPISDAIINSARKRGDEAFNSAAFRQMGGSGATGAAGISEGKNIVGNAYNFLDNANLPVDEQFNAAIAGLKSNLPRNLGGGISDRIQAIENAINDGSLSGRSWQDAIRGIKADRASLRGQPFSDQALGSLDNLESALHDLAGRVGPAGTADNLANANKLNSQFQTLAAALDNGPVQKADELFSAGRLDDASRMNGRKFGGRVSALMGNRPFYELTTAGKAVMPNLTPDSGTAGRALLYSTLFGGVGGGGIGFATADEGQGGEGGMSGALKGLAVAGALAAPYSKSGQKIIQNALLRQRPRDIERFGQFLISHPKLAGMFGSAMGRDYVYQPELDQ
jgi:hypothetical protein